MHNASVAKCWLIPNLVPSYLQYPLERLKIPIRREHTAVPARSNRADEEVGIRALHASATALVEESRRQLVVFRLHWQIRKSAQLVAQALVLLIRPDAGQQFLADWPDHHHTVGDDEAFKLLGNGIVSKR